MSGETPLRVVADDLRGRATAIDAEPWPDNDAQSSPSAPCELQLAVDATNHLRWNYLGLIVYSEAGKAESKRLTETLTNVAAAYDELDGTARTFLHRGSTARAGSREAVFDARSAASGSDHRPAGRGPGIGQCHRDPTTALGGRSGPVPHGACRLLRRSRSQVGREGSSLQRRRAELGGQRGGGRRHQIRCDGLLDRGSGHHLGGAGRAGAEDRDCARCRRGSAHARPHRVRAADGGSLPAVVVRPADSREEDGDRESAEGTQ